MLTPWKKSYDKPRQHIKKQRSYFTNKGLSSLSYGFSSSHVWMWVLNCKDSWVLKNWCFWTVVFKTLESPLDCKEIQAVHPKGDQSWVLIGSACIHAKSLQLCPTLYNPMDCSPPGSSVHGILQARILEWVAMPFSKSIGRTDAKAEASILQPPVGKSRLVGKDPDAGKDWRQEEEEMTEDEMVGWHHRLDGHEFEHYLEVGAGQGSLVCCSPWVTKSWA